MKTNTKPKNPVYFVATTVAVILTVLLSSIVLPVTDKANAADLSKFDAGRIIDDSVFFNGNALSAQQVQSFLDSKVPQCTINNGQPSHAAGARAGINSSIADVCLKNYRQQTPNMSEQPGLCGPYQGSPSESAAEIIHKIGKTCNISQKVLLVLLEKEQSLVTDSWPSDYQYNHSTGFACYDNGQPCVAQYSGFFYQVWAAARQFQRYGTGSFTWYPVGQTSNVLYQANNPSCGTKPVFISNRATAALYYYTPYTPNSAALNAGYGTGDVCSAYGNRNFYQFFVDWFGSTKSDFPSGVVDSLSTALVNGQQTMKISGWAFDPAASSQPIAIHSYVVDPGGTSTLRAVMTNDLRGDVNSAVGISGNHGFSMSFPITMTGTYKVCTYAIAATAFSAGNKLLSCKEINYRIDPPAGVVDSLSTALVNGQQTMKISGWAFDPAASSQPIAIHSYVVDPSGTSTLRAVMTNDLRGDVNSAVGISGNHGFSMSFPITMTGTYKVCTYAIAATAFSAGNKLLSCKEINYRIDPPAGVVDSLSTALVNGQQTMKISGWAFDPAASSQPIAIHSYVVDPSGTSTLRAVMTNDLRGDVNSAVGISGNHGFSMSFPITMTGTYKVCTYAIAATAFSAGNKLLSCKEINYRIDPPAGVVDSLSTALVNGQQTMKISGWAFDPAASSQPIAIHSYVVDPSGTSTLRAVMTNDLRGDVNSAVGISGNHGFSMSFPITMTGTYKVCTYAIAATAFSAGNKLLSCKNLSAP